MDAIFFEIVNCENIPLEHYPYEDFDFGETSRFPNNFPKGAYGLLFNTILEFSISRLD